MDLKQQSKNHNKEENEMKENLSRLEKEKSDLVLRFEQYPIIFIGLSSVISILKNVKIRQAWY